MTLIETIRTTQQNGTLDPRPEYGGPDTLHYNNSSPFVKTLQVEIQNLHETLATKFLKQASVGMGALLRPWKKACSRVWGFHCAGTGL